MQLQIIDDIISQKIFLSLSFPRQNINIFA